MAASWNLQKSSASPVLCTAAYSTLHQEHLYLLQLLADEQARCERLTRVLESMKAKTKKEEDLDASSETFRKLKKSVRGISFKIARSQKTSRYLADSLPPVVQSMQLLERNQWRLMNDTYRRQTEFPLSPLNASLMSPMETGLEQAVPELGLFFPMAPNAEHFQTPQETSFSPISLLMPAAPYLHPQAMPSPYYQPPGSWPMSPNTQWDHCYPEPKMTVLSPLSECFSPMSPMLSNHQAVDNLNRAHVQPEQANVQVKQCVPGGAGTETENLAMNTGGSIVGDAHEFRRRLSSLGYESVALRALRHQKKALRKQHST